MRQGTTITEDRLPPNETIDSERVVMTQTERIGSRSRSTNWPSDHCSWLAEAMRQLSAIQSLPPGWDSYGAPIVDPRVLNAAGDLLTCLSMAEPLEKPHINPTRSGGVQFEWESGSRYFELELVGERAATWLYQDQAAGIEEEGEIFENELLNRIVGYIRKVSDKK